MSGPATQHALSALRRFTRATPLTARCELCAAPIGEPHAHVLDTQERTLSCACRACGSLFCGGEDARRVYVETRVVALPGLRLDEVDWSVLDVPVRLLFLSPSRVHRCLFATYPNPQGAVHARLPVAAWEALAGAHPELSTVIAEVEALVIDGRREHPACSRVSLDVAQGLLGRLAAHPRNGTRGWPSFERGLSELLGGAHA